ncbi:ABC transporter permease [Chitinophaga silvatica]|uniref:ABC transporter permease n=1 Tax=Chitinophaga silvatica TaxID=2282649 RepID=A0A3E1YHU9_9BACT|nr:ABC transporter permease [Chitinophaga silvatica]RFS26951.1 ABC transporter permease [Chitinophaga silvatica]
MQILSSFKLSIRTLMRNRAFSLINIIGLSIGVCASLIIFLIIHYEYSFDVYQSKRDRIYRVVTTGYSNSGEVLYNHSMVNVPLARTLRAEFPALEKVAAFQSTGGSQIYIPRAGKEEKRVLETKGIGFIEPSLFEIFDFKWIKGNAQGLSDPNTVVLAESVAKNYFDDPTSAIGQIIQLWSYRIPLTVVGVYKDLPENTDVPLRIGISYTTGMSDLNTNNDWRSLRGGSQCFVLASEKANMKELQARLPDFVKRNFLQRTAVDPLMKLTFQPLKQLHSDDRFGTIRGDALSETTIFSLAIIALFLIIVACINFINLATAQSLTRARQVGIQKVLGRSNSQLIKTFLGETALLTFAALLLGCLMTWIAIPYINQLTQRSLTLNLIESPSILLFLIVLGILITLLAGSYPAIVLVRFNPVAAIKDKITSRSVGGISIRRALVVLQFVVAQLLIIGMLVVMKQMDYFRNRPLGFQKEAIVTVDLPSDSTLKLRYQNLRQAFLQVKGVEDASICSSEPASNGGRIVDFYYQSNTERVPFNVKLLSGDTSYFNTFKLKLAAGRMPYQSDTTREIVVNETLVRKLGMKSPDEIIGKMVGVNKENRFPVVGVLKDFNNKTLHEEIKPLVFTSDLRGADILTVRLNPNNLATTLGSLRETFAAIYPTYIYEIDFFDHTLNSYYQKEEMTGSMFKIFAFLAILISCLGLYGLISFMTLQRLKEVGIRKVLGASIQSIVLLFSKEFAFLILIAFFIAAPVGYYFMEKWLNNFYFHTGIGWQIFLFTIIVSVIITAATVGIKSIRAAMADPVKSLKNR